MKGALTIAGREIRSAFATPLAYVVIAGFSLLAAFFFFSFLSNFNNQLRQTMLFASVKPSLNELVVMPYFQTLEIILIFLVPLLTMRSIAEEKRSGTFEVLITSPISGAGIVMGKFIGAAVIALVMLGISLLYPAVLIVLADPEPGPILAGFFGLVLFALSFIAVGIA
ncbi:MAG TPA: ABC transporter permease, partial [Oligoflexia bacterium]|nr:ABC transporter permease [Oligoflexia bacterium]